MMQLMWLGPKLFIQNQWPLNAQPYTIPLQSQGEDNQQTTTFHAGSQRALSSSEMLRATVSQSRFCSTVVSMMRQRLVRLDSDMFPAACQSALVAWIKPNRQVMMRRLLITSFMLNNNYIPLWYQLALILMHTTNYWASICTPWVLNMAHINYICMQSEAESSPAIERHPNYNTLITLLNQSLTNPTPQNQLQLTQTAPQVHFAVISNPEQPTKVRQAACSALRLTVSKREVFQHCYTDLLSGLELVYSKSDGSIKALDGSLEALIENIITLYLNDEAKLTAFERIMETVGNNNTLGSLGPNERLLKLADIMLLTMDVTTINNQVCVGSLLCYLKQIYYSKFKNEVPGSIDGRGSELMQQAEERNELRGLIAVQVEIVKMIRSLIEKIQEQEDEDGMEETDNIAKKCITDSKESEALLSYILTVNGQVMFSLSNPLLNYFKSELIELYYHCYEYHPSKDLFLACLQTVAHAQPHLLIDHTDIIVSDVLKILQRSTGHAPYSQDFYSFTQILVLKMFQLSAAGASQRANISNDPDHFVEIADDYCQTQESELSKVRSGSLLYSLCLSVDGNLTVSFRMAMIALLHIEKSLSERYMPQNVREEAQKSQKDMQNLLGIWGGDEESLSQVSLLVLCCISDLVQKRQQNLRELNKHLKGMGSLFNRQGIFEVIPAIITVRYIQLYSYYSSPYCLDPFLPLYHKQPIFAASILKTLQSIINFHDRKSEDMRLYVASITTTTLLLSNTLTPLLEKTIVEKHQLVLCVKQRLLEKMVGWFMDYYSKENMFGCNKITNLLGKVLDKYPLYMVRPDPTIDPINIELLTLNDYMRPIYKLRSQETHPCEECIVELAMHHIECICPDLSKELAGDFLKMAVQVTENNQGVLNKCLELMSRLLALPVSSQTADNLHGIHIDVAQQLLPCVLRWLEGGDQEERRLMDYWGLLALLECMLVVLSQEAQLQLPPTLVERVCRLAGGQMGSMLQLKGVQVVMLLARMTRHLPLLQWLSNCPFSFMVPPYERSYFAIYLCRVVPLFTDVPNMVRLIRIAITLIQPNQHYFNYLKDYEERLYIQGTDDIEIDALQTHRRLVHPLGALKVSMYLQFKTMLESLSSWEEVKAALGTDVEVIRMILGHEVVGGKVRRIAKIKRGQ